MRTALKAMPIFLLTASAAAQCPENVDGVDLAAAVDKYGGVDAYAEYIEAENARAVQSKTEFMDIIDKQKNKSPSEPLKKTGDPAFDEMIRQMKESDAEMDRQMPQLLIKMSRVGLQLAKREISRNDQILEALDCIRAGQ